MPTMSTGPRQPVVFISYAHEDEAFDASVGALAEWLRGRGFEVISDHQFKDSAPSLGWTAWMQHSIEGADVVLIVCTPTMRAVFERRGNLIVRGAIVESAFIIGWLRPRLTNNTSCFPILPDGGDRQDVPVLLREWFNDHRFPSGYERIERLVGKATLLLGGFPMEILPTLVTPAMRTHHEQMTCERLAMTRDLRVQLARELGLQLPSTGDVDAETIVDRFHGRPAASDEVIARFFAIRRAFQDCSPHAHGGEFDRAVAAATALYCLAAFQLIDVAKIRAAATASGRAGLIQVPTNELLVCAIIAGALSGGRLEIILDGAAEIPPSDGSHLVRVPENGDGWWSSFEAELYRVMFRNEATAPAVAESGSLTQDQRWRLSERIKACVHVRRQAFTLLVPGVRDQHRLEQYAQEHRITVMEPSPAEDSAAQQLIGMPVGQLIAGLREFFGEVRSNSRTRVPAAPGGAARGSPPLKPGPASAPVAAEGGTEYHFTNSSVTFAQATAPGATAQAGEGHQAHVQMQHGIDSTAMLKLLDQVVVGFEQVSDGKARQRLAELVQEARTECSSTSAPSPGRLTTMLEKIKLIADALEGGQVVQRACQTAIAFAARFMP